MNNEEKILAALKQMNNTIIQMDSKFEARFEQMDSKFEARFNQVDSRLDRMESQLEDVRIFQLKVENEYWLRICANYEGFLNALDKGKEHSRRISALEKKSDNLSGRVSILELKVKPS